jgi:uncharacterized protein (TIGR03067 family)
VPWTKPEDLPYAADQPLPKLGCVPDADVFAVAFADGRIQYIPKKTPENVIRGMITWNTGVLDETARKELDDLKGTWVATAWEANGKPTPNDSLKEGAWRLVIKSNEVVIHRSKRKDSYLVKRLDPKAGPREIDLDDEGTALAAIYKLEGEKLTICFGKEGRPTEFKSKDGQTLAVFERKK